MRGARLLVARSLGVAALVAFAAQPVAAASRYDPALRFRALRTPHFIIYFHQREEAVANRFAVIAENVHQALTARLETTPPARTHVILVDQNDLANGWATPLPYDTIEITIAPPAPRDIIGNTDDWLRLVFVHEYTHILQLDRSRGFASALRAVFGRAPISFPNLFLPTWQIEGLATFEESALTGRGRVNAPDFALFVTQAARERRPFPLDRASSDFDDWPAGNTPYAYGSLFQQYLADRFGDDKLADLQRRTAGKFYFLSSPAFRQTFGSSLGDLWKDFERAQRERVGGSVTDSGRRLTRQGFVVAAPTFVRSATGAIRVLYSARNSHDFPALMAVEADGRTHRVATRYYGEHLSVTGDGAIFDQVELAKSVALRSDLYLLHMRSGHVSRLTNDGRLLDPAVAPVKTSVACIRTAAGERHLVIFDLPPGAWPDDVPKLRSALAGRPRLELSEAGIEYSSPRWSPDGRLIAVARQVRGGASQIVVFDTGTATTTVVMSADRGRNVTPVWTPDGRTIVFASERDGRPFNLYAVDVQTPNDGGVRIGPVFQVTDFATGATYPDVSPDNRQVAYVGYTSAGYDVYVLPLDRAAWRPLPDSPPGAGSPPGGRSSPGTADRPHEARPHSEPDSTQAPDPLAESQTYRPWGTLLPRYWMPAFDESDQQLKLGAQTSGVDVLGRHAWAATVLYRVAGEAGAPGSRRYDWIAGYTYDRWLPALFLDASDRTHFLRDVQLRDGSVVPADLREQNAEVGVFVPDFHVRREQSATVSLNFQRQAINIGGLANLQSNRTAVRAAWAFNSAKLYGYSISQEQGATVGITGEFVRRGLGADANADAATLDGRAYLRLGGRHTILAIRAAGGAARGDERTSRFFYLGGSGPNSSPVDFGSDALNLLRGFDQNAFGGTRIVLVNIEYRVPLLRVERGIGTWPVFLRTVHAAGFFDTGKAWLPSSSNQPFAHSAGAELAADFRLGYELPLTTVVGVAWPHDPGGVTRTPTVYFRIGRAF